MANTGKQVEEDEFFVLLLSFSSFDEKVFRKLKIIFLDAFPNTSQSNEINRDAVLPTEQIEMTPDLGEGSEKPTLHQGLENRKDLFLNISACFMRQMI